MSFNEGSPGIEPIYLSIEDFEWGMNFKLLPHEAVLQREFLLRLRQDLAEADYAREYSAAVGGWRPTLEGFEMLILYEAERARRLANYSFDSGGLILNVGPEAIESLTPETEIGYLVKRGL
ncbi:MAG: hypothetical protein JWO96_529 [Candidatus Saccharibacteria bacterium]|nr:hypothetical protein [Candidatus Saccharibacteria bacterium]